MTLLAFHWQQTVHNSCGTAELFSVLQKTLSARWRCLWCLSISVIFVVATFICRDVTLCDSLHVVESLDAMWHTAPAINISTDKNHPTQTTGLEFGADNIAGCHPSSPYTCRPDTIK